MTHYTYKTSGTCSRRIDFDIDTNDDTVHNVVFLGGCNGNLKAIPALIEGSKVSDVVSRIRGIQCGFKKTSCADQLAKALEEAQHSEQQA